MFEMINDAVQPPDGVSFDDIRAKIEKQSDEERESSRTETLLMLEDKKAASLGIKRITAFAASVAAVIGLGAALIVLAMGTTGYDTSSAETAYDCTETVDDCIAEENTDESQDMTVNQSASITDSAQQEDGWEETDSAENNGCSDDYDSFAGTFTTTTTADSEYVTHEINTMEITVDLPADAYVSGRNVSSDFELLEVYGMSAAQLEANYKNRNIYCNAVWYDDDADVTEIVIKMTTDDISSEIFDLSKASEEQLAEIGALYLDYEQNIDAVVGAKYFDVSLVEHEQALFFRAEGVVSNRSGRSNHLQYMTIINGCRVEITLIEHFGIENELTGEEPEEISQTHAQVMERVIQSVHWERVKSNFWHENRGVVFYGAIIIAGIAAIVVVFLLPDNKGKSGSKAAAEKALAEAESTPEDENSDDASEIPDGKAMDDTPPDDGSENQIIPE